MSIRTSRSSKRLIAAAVAVAVTASTFAVSTSPVSAAATVTEQTRIAGADRYATANAVAIARSTDLAGAVTTVVLASGENFPDGLAASALAGALNAPMLLTEGAALPASVLTAITTIKTANANFANIVIIGGESVVSASIATQLTALGYTVTRISGADRYATANAVAAAVRTNNGGTIGTFGGYRTAFLANGTNFPDALAASAQAYKGAHPLFLTDGNTLTAETAAAMVAAGVQQVIILGGTAAVSPEVATAVGAVSGVITTTRVSGANRYETATALATTLGAVDADFVNKAFVVSGTNFPDALVAAQLAGGATGGGAIIPVTSPLPAAVSTWVTANQSTLATIRAIGGTAAVPADVVASVKSGATLTPLSATIAAVDGATTATVTFSAPVAAVAAGNFTVTSALGANKPVAAGPTLNAGPTPAANTVATITLDASAKFQPGDIIQVVAGAIASAANADLKVATTTFTVVANTAAPVATLTAYSGATVSGGSPLQKVWVSFDQAVTDFDCAADLTLRGPTIGAPTDTAYFGTGTAVVTGRTFSCPAAAGKAAIAAGSVVTLLANAVSSSASTPVKNAVTTAVAAADTTAPVLQTARYSQTAVGGVQASLANVGTTSAGVLAVTARAGTATAGRAGNTWKVATVVGTAGSGTASVAVNSTTKVVTITADVTMSALTAASTLNANAAFSALFVASVTNDGDLTGFTAGSGTFLTGGRDVLTVTLTFSEALSAAAQGDFSFSSQITDVGSQTLVTSAATNNGLLTGVLTLTLTTSGAPLGGVTTVTAAATILDRAGNAVVTSGTSHVVAMTPAS